MGKAARAIIIEHNKMLVMHRNKNGSEYYTLVGGRLNEGETSEQALVREILEETGLHITEAQLVFTETHGGAYNDQDIYLCNIAPHSDVAIQEYSEEGLMNRYGLNTHQPFWIDLKAFEHIAFRTPQLQAAIVHALKKGFPKNAIAL